MTTSAIGTPSDGAIAVFERTPGGTHGAAKVRRKGGRHPLTQTLPRREPCHRENEAGHTAVVIGEDFHSVLSRAQGGDEEAFESLWRDLNPALLRYLGLNGEAAEDVASDTWASVVKGLRRFTGDESAWRGWVFITARRRAVDAGRRRSRCRPKSSRCGCSPDCRPRRSPRSCTAAPGRSGSRPTAGFDASRRSCRPKV
jgi:hypothetical protein